MKAIRYQAHNVLGVKDVDFDLDGRHLFLVGGVNEEGKSSSLKGLVAALCGRSGMDWPEVFLRDGEEEGSIRVDLSGDAELHEDDGFTVDLKLERRRDGSVLEKFRILDSSGEPAAEPRRFLQRLYSARAFDPLAFDRMKRKEQRDMLCKLVGVDTAEFDKRHQRAYDERKSINRQGKALKAVIEDMPDYPDAPEKNVDVAELMTELERRQNANREAANKSKALHDLEGNLGTVRDHIADLEKQLKAARASEANLEGRIAKAKDEIAKCRTWDVNEISDKIKSAQDVNYQVDMNRSKAEKKDELNKLRKQSEELTETLRTIDKEKQDALAAAEWPVPGLSVDSEGVLYEDLPFDAACKSKRIFVSTMIGIALNPKLRLFVCEDGNDLDLETLEVLETMLKRHNFQMILEFVTRGKQDEDRCAVVIEGGCVKPREEVKS